MRGANSDQTKDFIYIYENVVACTCMYEAVILLLCKINACEQNGQQHLCMYETKLGRINS